MARRHGEGEHGTAMKPLSALIEGALLAYQWVVSPVLGPRCRFLPRCSDYAREAVRLHGAGRGTWLAAKRLCRCHPLGGSGLDPVPPQAPLRR